MSHYEKSQTQTKRMITCPICDEKLCVVFDEPFEDCPICKTRLNLISVESQETKHIIVSSILPVHIQKCLCGKVFKNHNLSIFCDCGQPLSLPFPGKRKIREKDSRR